MAVGERDNFSGDFVVTAPTGGYTKGLIYALASGEYVVARQSVSAGADCLVAAITDQPIEVTKNSGTGEGATQGGNVYVNGSAQADANATGNTFLVGVVFHETATAAATTVKIRRGATAAS